MGRLFFLFSSNSTIATCHASNPSNKHGYRREGNLQKCHIYTLLYIKSALFGLHVKLTFLNLKAKWKKRIVFLGLLVISLLDLFGKNVLILSFSVIVFLVNNRAENMARKAAGEEPLPEEDPANPIFKPLPEPSRLDSFLITNQISNYCNQINGYGCFFFSALSLTHEHTQIER